MAMLPDLLSAPVAGPADAWRLLDCLAHGPTPTPAAREARPQHAVAALLDGLGNPHRRLCAIHIAGSKGKGSTALLTEAMLEAAGLKTGTFTSPHLVRWTERIRVRGAEIEAQALAAALETLRPVLRGYCARHPDHPPTFFDVLTAVAFYLFERAALDVVVIEAGLGGRLDSTNVVVPRVACITRIELEHTDRLGTTLAQIAAHKAGVIKAGVPAVIGILPEPAHRCVIERCVSVGASAWVEGREFSVVVGDLADAALALDLRLPGMRFPAVLPALGAHLGHCAVIALACVARSGLVAAGQLAGAASAGLASVRLPGRTEIVGRAPWCVVDGAHTLASAHALRAALARLPHAGLHWLLSISSGKELDGLLRVLLQGADSVTLTRADPVRSIPPEQLAARVARLFPAMPAFCFDRCAPAVEHVRRRADPRALICCAGSVYMAGAARALLGGDEAGGACGRA